MLYGAFAVWRCSYSGIDSDFANLVLEADDILSGNFFRTGWNLTGISFISTDVPYFVLGTFLFGVSTKAYYFAGGAMYVAMMLAALLLVKDVVARRPIFAVVTFLATALMPCLFEIDLARAHTGVFVLGFIAVWIWMKMVGCDAESSKPSPLGKNKKIAIAGYIFVLALADMGDPIVLVMVMVPICLWSLILWIRREIETIEFVKHIVINLGGLLLGTFFDRLYFAIGGCNKNAFLDDKTFASLGELHDKFVIYLRAIFQMSDAGFELTVLTDVRTLFYAINTIAVVVCFVLIIINIIFLCMEKRYDFVTVVLGVGFLMMSALFILTNISVNELSARYICYFPAFMAVVFVRNTDLFFNEKNRLYGVIFFIMVLTVLGRVRDLKYGGRNLPYQQIELSDILKENGLENGYSTFWSSSVVTVLSEGQVSVRPVLGYNGNLAIDNWCVKDDWYLTEAHFVVTQPNDVSGVTTENIIGILGMPQQAIECGNYQILIYDEDISEYIVR